MTSQEPWETLLQDHSDRDIARRYGIARETVRKARIRLGIPSPGGDRTPYPWTSEALTALGTIPDQELAEQVGCSQSAVRYQRNLRRIPPFSPGHESKRREWTYGEDQLLGTRPDEEIAALLNRCIQSVQIRRHQLGIAAHFTPFDSSSLTPDLGKAPDQALAAVAGTTKTIIYLARKRLGISPYCDADWAVIDPLLGKSFDHVVANATGLSLYRIRTRRQKLGILPFRRRKVDR